MDYLRVSMVFLFIMLSWNLKYSDSKSNNGTYLTILLDYRKSFKLHFQIHLNFFSHHVIKKIKGFN